MNTQGSNDEKKHREHKQLLLDYRYLRMALIWA